MNEEALPHWGLSRRKQQNVLIISFFPSDLQKQIPFFFIFH